MSRHTLSRLTTLGVPLDEYLRFPEPATVQDFDGADHVVAVKGTEHRPLITQNFPAHLERVEFWEVHDLDCAGPEVAIPHLEREVMALLNKLPKTDPIRLARIGE
jgi:protein-tyrosine phosphatase